VLVLHCNTHCMQYMLSRSCTAIYVCDLLLSGSAVWNHFSLEQYLCDVMSLLTVKS